MKKSFLMILGLGIVCSQLLSQEPAICIRFADQPKKAESTPEGSSSRNAIGLNQFNIRLNQPGLSRRLGVQSPDYLIPFWDATRNNFKSDLRTSEEKGTEKRIRTSRLISGLGLAVSWVGTVIVDLLVYEDGYRQYTLIPVVGPWITLTKLGSDPGWSGAKPLLILSGVAQAGFATFFIISLTRHPKPRETKNVVVWANFNSLNLRIQF